MTKCVEEAVREWGEKGGWERQKGWGKGCEEEPSEKKVFVAWQSRGPQSGLAGDEWLAEEWKVR